MNISLSASTDNIKAALEEWEMKDFAKIGITVLTVQNSFPNTPIKNELKSYLNILLLGSGPAENMLAGKSSKVSICTNL